MGGNKNSETQRWLEIFLLGKTLVTYSPYLAILEIRAQNSESLRVELQKRPQTYASMDGHCGHSELPCKSIAGLRLCSYTRVSSQCEQDLSVGCEAESGGLGWAVSSAKRQVAAVVPMAVWLYTKKEVVQQCRALMQEIVAGV
jgi:hypothetical protein